MKYHDPKPTLLSVMDKVELGGVRKDALRGKALPGLQHLLTPVGRDPGRLVSDLHIRCLQLVALDNLCVDKGRSKAWGYAGVIKGRFARPVGSCQNNKSRTGVAVT